MRIPLNDKSFLVIDKVRKEIRMFKIEYPEGRKKNICVLCERWPV